jgi:F-type H+-transporting ATPase subunit epsilon
MKCEIVTPVGIKYSGECLGVIAPGMSGDLGILPGHQALLSALRTGVCTVQLGPHNDVPLVVDGGYVHVVGGQTVTITTELCEKAEDLALDVARKQLDEASSELAATKDGVETELWKVRKRAVDLAETRVRVAATK